MQEASADKSAIQGASPGASSVSAARDSGHGAGPPPLCHARVRTFVLLLQYSQPTSSTASLREQVRHCSFVAVARVRLRVRSKPIVHEAVYRLVSAEPAEVGFLSKRAVIRWTAATMACTCWKVGPPKRLTVRAA